MMAYVSRAWEVRFKLLTSETEFLPVLWWGLGVCGGGKILLHLSFYKELLYSVITLIQS